MVLPYVHATAMVLTLISLSIRSATTSRRWNRAGGGIAGRGIWIGPYERSAKGDLVPLENEKYDDPGGEMFAGASISLNHGELVTVNSYRFIDAENSPRVRSHFGLMK